MKQSFKRKFQMIIYWIIKYLTLFSIAEAPFRSSTPLPFQRLNSNNTQPNSTVVSGQMPNLNSTSATSKYFYFQHNAKGWDINVETQTDQQWQQD